MLRHLPSRTGFAEESWLPRRTCGLCKLSLLLIYERMPVDFVVLSLNSRAYTLVRREIFRSVSVPFRPKSFYAITAFQSVTSYESIKVSSDPNESPSNLSSVVMLLVIMWCQRTLSLPVAPTSSTQLQGCQDGNQISKQNGRSRHTEDLTIVFQLADVGRTLFRLSVA
jgi:hypothetical protein